MCILPQGYINSRQRIPAPEVIKSSHKIQRGTRKVPLSKEGKRWEPRQQTQLLGHWRPCVTLQREKWGTRRRWQQCASRTNTLHRDKGLRENTRPDVAWIRKAAIWAQEALCYSASLLPLLWKARFLFSLWLLCSRGNGINHCVMFLTVTHLPGHVLWLRNATCLRFVSFFFQIIRNSAGSFTQSSIH